MQLQIKTMKTTTKLSFDIKASMIGFRIIDV